MRVIAGQFKGRRLKTIVGQRTRPTTDKIKESLFQRIGPFFSEGSCLDLFAGSGALGIEALSRGIGRAVFVDHNRHAIKVIRYNLQVLNIDQEYTQVLSMDAFRALRLLSKQDERFTIIFLDPPYKQINFEKLLQNIGQNNLMANNGLIVCEHQADEKLPKEVNNLLMIKQFFYGKTTSITLYQLKEEE